ncbi:MAG: hypothetical protein JWM41_986 [Gemmatimonadetes bacterium]|nr:hypothetical protein [Gemmatimonadota bacterium]
MSTQKSHKKRRRRRSAAVPLTIVPALAALMSAAGCSSSRALDPCEPSSYEQVTCDSAVSHHGYWYGGTWYPHTYAYLPIFYYNGYRSYLGGGRMRSVAPTVYAPPSATPSRPAVVRGGFGGIGEGHASAGS